MTVSWSGVHRVASDRVGGKASSPNSPQEWEKLSLSPKENINVLACLKITNNFTEMKKQNQRSII